MCLYKFYNVTIETTSQTSFKVVLSHVFYSEMVQSQSENMHGKFSHQVKVNIEKCMQSL